MSGLRPGSGTATAGGVSCVLLLSNRELHLFPDVQLNAEEEPFSKWSFDRSPRVFCISLTFTICNLHYH